MDAEPNPRLRRSAVSPAISKLANVIIPVADQDRKLQFYTEALGLEKRVDLPPGLRDPEGNTLMVVEAR
jgi:catechol 2,3-dioxygenase-like lactoylglutathione lyase family enzyme